MKKLGSKDVQSLDSQDKPQLRLRAKLIWFSITRGKSSFVEMHLILLFSYLQIFFLTTRFIRKFGVDDHSFMRGAFKSLEELLTFDDLFGYSDQDNGLIVAFAIIVAYFVITITTPLLLIRSIRAYKLPNKLVTLVWGVLIRFHNPIIFFLIHTLTGRIQEEFNNDNLKIFSSDALNDVVFILSIVFMIINLALSFFRTVFLHDYLPKKNLLSCKNSFTDQITLLQKVIIPVLCRVLVVEAFSTVIIIALNTFLCLFKLFKFYNTYPRYNIKALQFNAYLLTIEASIVLFTPILFILNTLPTVEISLTHALIMITMILPFLMFLTKQIITRGLKNIIFSPPHKLNPHKLIHRIILMKQMKSQKGKYDEVSGSMNLNRLYFATLATQISSSFGEYNTELLSMDFNDKEVQHQIVRLFLERLEKAHPHDNLIKLSLIKYYTKTLKLFSLAIAKLSLLQSISPRVKVSKDLLYFEIQESISTYYKETNDSLNLADYLINMKRVEDFKLKIHEQLNLQKQFWAEYNKNSPNAFALYKLSQKIELQKKIIHSKWNKDDFNKEYSQPFLLYASYLLILNDSVQEGMRYIKSYNLFNPKMKEQDGHEYIGLSPTNLYSDETFYITIMTAGDDIGVIKKCSQAIKKTLNYDSDAIVGLNINNLMSDYIAQTHNDLLLRYVSTGQTKILNYVRSIFIKDNQGFLHRASIYAKIHPFFSQDLYLTALIRPLKSYEEYMIITPQGIIDSTSSDLGTLLDIIGKRIPMTTVCQEFEELNEVFNYFGYKKLRPETHGAYFQGTLSIKYLDKVTEEDVDPRYEAIYNKWCLEGGELKFCIPSDNIIHNHHRKIKNYVTFLCKIYNYWFANDFIKIIVIQRANHLEDEYLQLLENKGIKKDAYYAKNSVTEPLPRKPRKESCEFSEIEEREEFKKLVKIQIASTLLVTSPTSKKDTTTKLKDTYNSSKYIKDFHLQSILSLDSCRDDFALLKVLLSPKANSGRPESQKKNESPTNSSSRAVEIDIRPRPLSINSTSQATNMAREGRVHGEVNSVLRKKKYAKSAIVFATICFCLGIALFCSPIIALEKVKNDLDNLEALGTMIDLSNSAAESLLILNRATRIAFLHRIGLIDSIVNPLAEPAFKPTYDIIPTYIPILKDTVNSLWEVIQKIDVSFRSIFTSQDIRFLEYNNSLQVENELYMDMFTGFTLIMNRLYILTNKFTASGVYDPVDLLYIVRNGCSDLVVHNKIFSAMVRDYLKLAIKDQHMVLDWIFGVNITLVFIMLVVAVSFCYKFYRLELQKLRYFLRIREHELTAIKERLDDLEEALKVEQYHDLLIEHGSMRAEIRSIVKGTFIGQAKRIFKEPNMSDVKKNYLVKISFFVLILVTYTSLVSAVYSVVRNLGTDFNSGLSRLVALQAFLENSNLSFIGLFALYLPEYEPTIENIPTLTALNANLEIIAQSTNILTNAYKQSDGTIDPDILPLFNGNACDFVAEKDLSKCVAASAGLNSINIFSLMSALETKFSFYKDQYLSSDRSFESTRFVCTNTLIEVMPFTLTTRNILIFMIKGTRENFRNIYNELKRKLVAYSITKIIVFCVLFILAWRKGIKYMINCPNRIKLMLMIVPVNILISNKSLKPVLMKFCKGKDNFLKTDI